jgi:dTDP-4-dehydrorhamnose reductase/dTDP-4-dehydrorhamnose 3,5-epimerase
MKVTDMPLPEVKLIEPQYFEDYRGYYVDPYSSKYFHENGIDAVFVQDGHSLSLERLTLRGIHFQNNPKAQAKVARCTRGMIFDVVVDLRKNSTTYKKWCSVILSAENRKELFIPKGFGHAFLTLQKNTEVQYKYDELYEPEFVRSIRWNDPELGIKWPFEPAVISPQDKNAPTLKESDVNL